MIERILILLILMAAGYAAYQLYKRRQLYLATENVRTDPLLDGRILGIPTVVYFTSEGCVPCRLHQTPVLQLLQEELGENQLQIVRVDAMKDPDTASRWGVFSVPTTFILDVHGEPLGVHNGVVDVQTLKRELGVKEAI